MRRMLATLVLLMPLLSAAELPRLVPLIDLQAHHLEPPKPITSVEEFERFQSVLLEPFVFWSTDGLLCVLAHGDAQRVDCQDTTSGQHQNRERPRKVLLPVKALTLDGVTLARDGTIANGTQSRVANLRCGRSPFLDRKEYRYLPGPKARLAVIVLEEDDVRADCAALDAQCPAGQGKKWWRVFLATAECPVPVVTEE